MSVPFLFSSVWGKELFNSCLGETMEERGVAKGGCFLRGI